MKMPEIKKAHYTVVLLLVAVLLGVSIVLNYKSTYKLAHENAVTAGQMGAARAADKINDFLRSSLDLLTPASVSVERLLSENAPDERLRSLLRDQTERYIKEISPMYITVYGCFRGQYIGGDDYVPEPGYDPRSRPWYKAGRSGHGKPVIVSPYVDTDTGTLMFAVARELADGDSVLVIDINLDAVGDYVDNFNQGLMKTAYILDNNGTVVAHPKHGEIGRNYFSQEAIEEDRPELMRLVKGALEAPDGKYVSQAVDGSGQICLVFVQRVIGDWLVFVSINMDMLQAVVNASMSRDLVFSVVLALIIFVFIADFMRRERRHIREAERERNNAVAAVAAKSYFFAAVSHDIRTPLNSILGLVEILQHGGESEETQRKYLENIAFSGNTLMQLINNILDLSRLEVGKLKLAPSPCDFVDLAESTMNAFRFGTKRGEVALTCETDPSMPLLLIDGNRVRQIIFNLLGNASKFTTEGEIKLAAAYKPGADGMGTLSVTVTDTGIGIAKEDIGKLAKPFVQVNNQSQTGGTGLGLSICKQLLKLMGGELKIESELGKGSAFSFEIPGVKAVGRRKPAEGKQPAPVPTVARTDLSLLLVDDVGANLLVLKAMCRKLGFSKVQTAESGAAALKLIEKENFDVVLTDLWMPGMDGRELLGKIRENHNYDGIRVFAVTADVEFTKKPESIPFDGFVIKPVTLKSLGEILA